MKFILKKAFFFLILWLSFNSIYSNESLERAVSIQNAFQDVFQSTSPSVVSIATERTVNYRNHPYFNDPFFEHFFGRQQRGSNGQMSQKQTGLGSGIILSDDGFILTNQHVVGGMDKLTVKLKNEKTYEAKLIGADKITDIALLKIEAPKKFLKPIKKADSDKVKVGDWAIAIGAPLGYEQSFTVGVVSAMARSGLDDSGVRYIQTDAAINRGNSGGPLLDIYGRVVGINRMIVSRTGGSIGIGFAIPINDAIRVSNEIKKHGKVIRPWLGVGLGDLNSTLVKELKLSSDKGAVITQIVQGSPAQKSGLKLADVIISIDKDKIESAENVVTSIRGKKVGQRVKLVIIRDSKKISMLVPLEERN